MIADLTGALGALYAPLRRQGRERAIGRTLHVNMGTRRQPALLQAAGGLVQHRRVERRIEKHDVERLRRAEQEALRVLHHDDSVAAAESLQRLREMTPHLRLAIDEGHVSGTARERFETKRTAAREQIQAARAHDRLLQPVEKRFAHAIGRRPDRGERRKNDARAAPAAADDA